MRKVNWYLTIAISLYLISMGSVYAKDINWMVGNWVPKKKDVLTKLVVEREGDNIWFEAWQPCSSVSCFLGKVKAKRSVTIIQGPVGSFEIEKLSAKFPNKNGAVILEVEEPGKFVHLSITLTTSKSEANNKLHENYIFQKEEDIGQPPCTCVFDQNRMWNPEKIIWEGEEWQCAVYKDNGHCEKVQKINDPLTK